MCLQCQTNARVAQQEVIPGFHLMKLLLDFKDWKRGMYALVASGGPTLTIPWFARTPAQDEDKDFARRFSELVAAIACQINNLSPVTRHTLHQACKRAGCSSEKPDESMTAWLINHIAERQETQRIHLTAYETVRGQTQIDTYFDFDTVEEAIEWAYRWKMDGGEEDFGGDMHIPAYCEIYDRLTQETWTFEDEDDIRAGTSKARLYYVPSLLELRTHTGEPYNPDEVTRLIPEFCPECGRQIDWNGLTCEVCQHRFCDRCHAASADDGLFVCEPCEDKNSSK